MITIKRTVIAVALACMAVVCPSLALALPASHYAANSVLSEGKWAKVQVKTTGIQFLSSAQLKNLGFADPSKVNVYGYGGQLISENLDKKQVDDLPQVPVVRTEKGILFFGVCQTNWKRNTISGKNNPLKYEHIAHVYDDASYYFLSDRDSAPRTLAKESYLPSASARVVNTFTERQVHDKDLDMPANSGRVMVGEDFRSQNLRNFSFDLPDNADGDARFYVSFYTKATGKSSLLFTGNGTQLPAATQDNIDNVTGEAYYRNTLTAKHVEEAGDKLTIGIKFTPGGTLYLANLDYIRVEYTRHLRLTGQQLYFYLHDASDDMRVEVDGCKSSTRIWDVTDPNDIKEVDFALEGGKAVFGHGKGKYGEYVAFNPESVSLAPVSAGKVGNQNLHALPVPDMLIITPSQYASQARRVADLHERVDGMTVHVLTPEEIYTEFSCGTRDVSAFRKILKMWYDRGVEEGGKVPGHCLIMSRPTYDNKLLTETVKRAGYPRIPIWYSPTGNDKLASYSTDDFIGMLEDNPTSFVIGLAKINVAVGRMPVKSLAEATAAVDKLIRYVEKPNYGSWRNRVVLVADDQNYGAHLTQSQDEYFGFIASNHGKNIVYDRLYLDAYPLELTGVGKTFQEPKDRFFEILNDGVSFVSYIGHGSPTTWTDEHFLSWSDINSFTNKNPTYIYTATCEFCPYEYDEISGAEVLWLEPEVGAVGMITTSRSVYIHNNGPLSKRLGEDFFSIQKDGRYQTVGELITKAKNMVRVRETSSTGDLMSETNRLRFLILGDPALRLPTPTMTVAVDSLYGVDFTASDFEMPVIPARSTANISGRVLNTDGSFAEDFNGTLELTLFDAERPIETYGHGEEGSVMLYNDRKTKLYVGKTPVKNGRFSTRILMPGDIDQNFSPALLISYAFSSDGREAHGGEERFYVYGYDESASDDTEGPEITRFTLNSDNFKSGGAVNSSPLVLAEFNDESGINISNAGVGHTLTLILDKDKVLSDVASYYVPDSIQPTHGSLRYLLPELEAGEHTLELRVSDNAGNSTHASLDFTVSAHSTTTIADFSTDCNPARESVVFSVTADRPEPGTECLIEVFDLSGRRVWSNTSEMNSASDASVSVRWNLCDGAGHRVARGIYLYRATITNSKGIVDTMTKKLAVAAL